MSTPDLHSPAACLDGVAPLPHLGVIEARGPDAATFLHGQLTQDFALLGQDQARLAAWCSAKGRMLASFIGLRRGPDAVLLVGSRDLLPATLRRLSMFVLRAQVRLDDASTRYPLAGLAGNTPELRAFHDLPVLGKADFDGQTLVRLRDAAGQARALWIGSAESPWPTGPALDTARWCWGEVLTGVATVSAPIADALVPQMLNYESVDGVNFKKGCYPGQEVVARSQFRGTLKRRAYLVHAEAEPVPGQAVFGMLDPEQPCGLVAQAAAHPAGGFDAIISVQIAAAEAGPLHLDRADGPALQQLPLPYPLRDDI